MKCHYEVLEISQDADNSEIKSAYRKLALKWHPDKNLDNPDLAKEQFQIVQQAYEVLSDKQERAWYDAHRDQILQGASSEFQDKSLDVFQYFTTTCFEGYGDDEKGFYTVYRNVFDQIAKEDIEFMDEKEEFCEIPGFGKSDSEYEDFKAFYDYWMSYSTKKSYSWLDPYDIREGKGDRRVLKLIEKENKKVRIKAKKERNEEVRNLVAFVRKRDKRVQAYKKELDAKTLENRKKQEILSKQKRLERKKLHDAEEQADWLKFDNVQSELEEVEKHLAKEFGEELSNSEEEEEEDFNNLYCVACNKIFKTPKAFENHELSKKHRENVEILKEAMMDEDLESNMTDDVEAYNDLEDHEESLEDTIEEHDEISGEESIGEEENLTEMGRSVKKKKKKNKNKKLFNQNQTEEVNHHSGQSEDIDYSEGDNKESDQEAEDILNKKSKKKKKKARNVVIENDDGPSDEVPKDLGLPEVSDDDFDFGTSKSQRKKNKKASANKSKTNTSKSENKGDQEQTNTADVDNNDPPQADIEVRKSKKNIKKEKKTNKKDIDVTDLNEIDTSHCCVTCKGDFPSKNKLFDHLKKTGHGVYIPPKAKQTSKKASVRN